MLGRDHLLLSVATVSLVLAPLFTLYPTAVLVALAGTAIGSLIPDADSPDAAIFHTEVRGLRGRIGRVLNSFGVLYPVFGYVTKYLIYKPAVWFYDTVVFEETRIVERHRGFLHSVLGLGTATTLTGVYLLPVLHVLQLFSVGFLGVFLLAYLVGALLHLVEDSCTRSGIQWSYPVRRWKVRGELKTTPKLQDSIYQRVFLVVLGGGVGVLFFLPSMYGQGSAIPFAVIGLVTGFLLWVGFARFVAKCWVCRFDQGELLSRLRNLHKRMVKRDIRLNEALRDAESILGTAGLPRSVGEDACGLMRVTSKERLAGGRMAWESLAAGAVLLAVRLAGLEREVEKVARFANATEKRVFAAARKIRRGCRLCAEYPPVREDVLGLALVELEDELDAEGIIRSVTIDRELLAMPDEEPVGPGTPRVTMAGAAV